MDDDMRLLGALLSRPGPAPEAVAAGRRSLEQAIRSSAQPARRWRWPAVAATAVAAGVAAAVVIPSLAQNGPAHTARHVVGAPSGREILLDAARTAAVVSQAPGTYWYVKETYDFTGQRAYTLQTWTTRGGGIWYALGGGLARMKSRSGEFHVGWASLTLSQLQKLPTTPAALKAWVANSRPATGPRSAETASIAEFLGELLYQVPAPPAVRAAAFEALATTPDVRTLGSVPGGQKLVISVPPAAGRLADGTLPAGAGQVTLVVNPATATVHSITDFEGTTTILADDWTRAIPATEGNR